MEEIHMYQHNIMYQVPTTNGFCELVKVNIDQEVEKTEDPFSVSCIGDIVKIIGKKN